MISIRYLHFAPFSDMSVRHRISLRGRISALLQVFTLLKEERQGSTKALPVFKVSIIVCLGHGLKY
jgi:hypothetical protein